MGILFQPRELDDEEGGSHRGQHHDKMSWSAVQVAARAPQERPEGGAAVAWKVWCERCGRGRMGQSFKVGEGGRGGCQVQEEGMRDGTVDHRAMSKGHSHSTRRWCWGTDSAVCRAVGCGTGLSPDYSCGGRTRATFLGLNFLSWKIPNF